MDFLLEYGAIINLRELLVTFSSEHATHSDDYHLQSTVLRVSGDCATLPPRSTTLITVETDDDPPHLGIAEGKDRKSVV